MPANLAGLIERVGKETGPDRELDEAIFCAFNPEYSPTFHPTVVAKAGLVGARVVPKYTASIDAIAALAEKVAPGQAWHILDRAMMDPRIKASAPLLPLLPIVAIEHLLNALAKGSSDA